MALHLQTGTPFSDNLFGGRRADLMHGLGGNDNINTGAGEDLIFGGRGGDYAQGGFGNDALHGQAGSDFMSGNDGDDALFGGAGDDGLRGDFGNDRLFGGGGGDRLYAGDRPDDARDALFGGRGDDFVYFDGPARGRAVGGHGVDMLVLRFDDRSGTAGPVTVQLTGDGFATAPGDGLELDLSGFEALLLTTGGSNDRIDSGDLADVIAVGSGGNVVHSFGGNDWLQYDTGGVNLIDAGDGHDLASIRHTAAGALSFTVTGTSGTDNFGSVISNAEQWRVTGNVHADQVSLGTEDDGFSGDRGDDSAYGNNGDDRLRGQLGQDTLFGGNGDDLLIGGSGADKLIGGAGADRFFYRFVHHTVDTVEDFETGLDEIAITSWSLTNGPRHGILDASQLSLDAAVGSHAQFVLTVRAGGDFTNLLWDANGSDAGGEHTLLMLRAAPILSADDIFIV